MINKIIGLFNNLILTIYKWINIIPEILELLVLINNISMTFGAQVLFLKKKIKQIYIIF